MPSGAASGAALPELASVSWRRRKDRSWLRRQGRLWQAWTVLYVIPLLVAAAAMLWLDLLLAPMAAVGLAIAWAVPELYANRGAGVVRPRRRGRDGGEATAQGLLGDLLGHEERELQRQTGLALERGRLGTWLVGESGALLVAAGGRRVHCFCVRTTDAELPPSDRIAHLLLALRTDEQGFATVANHAFTGASWRVRRRLPARMRPALDAAR
jgi:hypothetical protein